MAAPIERLKKLMGAVAFEAAQAKAAETTLNANKSTRSKSSKSPASLEYVDPAEHDRVESQEILNALLSADEEVGTQAPPDMVFSSLWATQKLGTEMLRVHDPEQQLEVLMERSLFWKRDWNVYYLISRYATSPILLVPEGEATQLLKDIYYQYRRETIDRGRAMPRPQSLKLGIELFGFPQPRFLGRVKGSPILSIFTRALREEAGPYGGDTAIGEDGHVNRLLEFPNPCANLKAQCYRQTVEYLDQIKAVEHHNQRQSLESTQSSIATAQPSFVKSATAAASFSGRKIGGRKVGQSLDRERWCCALRRIQRYLGLRSSDSSNDGEDKFDGVVQTLDKQPNAAFPRDLDVVFLCIDVEADERNQAIISEIGVATLDTRELQDIAPGEDARNWLDKVKARHFRITEHSHVRNHLYVEGNPDGFLSAFGSSEYVRLSQAPSQVQSCFEVHDGVDQPELNGPPKLRNVVFIGHQVKGDIKYLGNIGFDLLKAKNVVEVLSTDDLQRALKHDNSGGTSLARLLEEMNIDAWNLHNAGNDAAYTLQALLAMAVKGVSDSRPIVSLEERIQAAQDKAKTDAEAEWNSWNAAELKSGDGHAPIPFERSSLRG